MEVTGSLRTSREEAASLAASSAGRYQGALGAGVELVGQVGASAGADGGEGEAPAVGVDRDALDGDAGAPVVGDADTYDLGPPDALPAKRFQVDREAVLGNGTAVDAGAIDNAVEEDCSGATGRQEPLGDLPPEGQAPTASETAATIRAAVSSPFPKGSAVHRQPLSS